MTTRLLLVDDHAVVRSGLRLLLEAQPDLVIVGEAENGEEAIRRTAELQPDVVLMDIEMPGMNGIEAARRIKTQSPGASVLALTMYEDDQYFFEMLRAGASGYVPKRAAPDELASAIRAVSRGEVFIHPSLAGRLVQRIPGETPTYLFRVTGLTYPTEHYLLHKQKLQLLAKEYPAIDRAALGTARFVYYPARDGLNIPAFLTIPNEKLCGPGRTGRCAPICRPG